ncbi:MAG: hypothetical protein QG599_2052 [Pseudomonadota bacterium]|nr:hypothetical protein [Pseudomonadota bacterium]
MNGWTKTVSRFHNDLKVAMEPYQGRQLRTHEIAKITFNTPNLTHDSQFIYPSDHCINHTNKGSCFCVLHGEGEPIFEKIKRGLYLVRKTG